ncbi:hypothetical protein WN944_018527 [Citrus x changshan-huyou]|uniref:Uncharacterized protein n=1 Tax=Citrus x changshan-huyou TaxID=2935761 RepID=A0AAP0LUY6_9ROSI
MASSVWLRNCFSFSGHKPSSPTIAGCTISLKLLLSMLFFTSSCKKYCSPFSLILFSSQKLKKQCAEAVTSLFSSQLPVVMHSGAINPKVPISLSLSFT